MAESQQIEKRRQATRKILLMVGMVVLACVALRLLVSAALYIITSMRTGWVGTFQSDALPIILLTVIGAAALFGAYKVYEVWRK